ncbi:MAG: AbrB/MazE/SpoVT family DNA-binding domain-containing protein [Chlorobium sp.]|nr:AbrB/MazE/SpoVT family DNA-binding domain-containing protein [Chlorobium sp.]
MISTITTKGQITIPVAIRKAYGLHPNDRVDFIADGGRIILVPVKTLRDFRGSVTGSGVPDQERQVAKDALALRTIEEMS